MSRPCTYIELEFKCAKVLKEQLEDCIRSIICFLQGTACRIACGQSGKNIDKYIEG